MNSTPRAVIVLAAGESTRIKSTKTKLRHEIAGRSLLGYAVAAASGVEPDNLVVVINRDEQLREHLAELAPKAIVAIQEELAGTGAAVRAGLTALGEIGGEVIVTYADVPLLESETLLRLATYHRENRSAVTLLTAKLPDPTGYGRVVRDGDHIAAVVEQENASDEIKAITEINSGCYVFDAVALNDCLLELSANDLAEYEFTDVVRIAHEKGLPTCALRTNDAWQARDVNDLVQLSEVGCEMNRRILTHWMREGVTIQDPATTWIGIDVDLSPDAVLLPGVQLQGATSIATGAMIGPDTTLIDVEVGAHAEVSRTHAELSVIGEYAEVGPFARLRPGTILSTRGKIGTFVETKNAQIGEGAKVPHLTYCGDAVIEEGANIGAGTIFANYNSKLKFGSHVGKYAFVGSNSVLVAPVDVMDGAFVAAGSAVTQDVAPGTLAVVRAETRVIKNWAERMFPGSKMAEAAKESSGEIAENVLASRAKKEGQ